MRNQVVPKKILVRAMLNCMVFIASPYIMILENGGRRTNSILSRVLFILAH